MSYVNEVKDCNNNSSDIHDKRLPELGETPTTEDAGHVAAEYAAKALPGGELSNAINNLQEAISGKVGFDGEIDYLQDGYGPFKWRADLWDVLTKSGVYLGTKLSKNQNNTRYILWFEQTGTTSYKRTLVIATITSAGAPNTTGLSFITYINPEPGATVEDGKYFNTNYSRWDSTPTANSNNPVTSGGIKTYVDENKGTKLYRHSIQAGSSYPGQYFSFIIITNSATAYTKEQIALLEFEPVSSNIVIVYDSRKSWVSNTETSATLTVPSRHISTINVKKCTLNLDDGTISASSSSISQTDVQNGSYTMDTVTEL